MDEVKATEASKAAQAAGRPDWERLVLGENGIAGTIRLIVYIAIFALVFGSIFYFAR